MKGSRQPDDRLPAIFAAAVSKDGKIMNTHTPGPWEWDGKWTVSIPHAKGLTAFRTNPEDAQLIAAAPDLAAASRDFLRWFRTFIGDSAYNEVRADELDALRAALAKAGL